MVAVVVLAGTAATVVYELNFGRFTPQSVPVFVAIILGAFALVTWFGVWTATKLNMSTFLALFPLSSRQKLARFLVYGVGVGVAIYLTNRAVYLTSTTRPMRPWYVADIDSHYGLLVLAARSALLEETFFRLFGIPFLTSLLVRALYGWRPRLAFTPPPQAHPEPQVEPSPLIVAIAVVASALLFGLHHPFNPLTAILFGLTLGLVYLRAGWESAVVAHFLGNYLLFAGIYL